jgi:hypothetical protein
MENGISDFKVLRRIPPQYFGLYFGENQLRNEVINMTQV